MPPITHDPVTEQELAARAVAPRVTADALGEEIASEHYFTAREGALGEIATGDRGEITPDAYEQPTDHIPKALGLLTFCVLVLRNGFTLTGTSACASPENFDADVGKRLARADAVRQLWPLLGYQLRDRLHHADAMKFAVTSLQINAATCEGNAPVHDSMGNAEQAELGRTAAASYRAAIARLVP